MLTFFGRQPAFWIGFLVALVAAVVQTFLGFGLISDALAGQITATIDDLAKAILLLLPIITGLLIKPAVTPVVAPALPSGTKVEVITPEGQPNHTTTV